MNAVNLTTYREMITSTIGPYLGSSNKTWACFFWPIQVAVALGNLVLSTKEGNVPYWVKPNSAGMDSVLVPRLMDIRKLFQVRMKTTDSKSQAMMQLSRATPKALEDLGRLLIDGGKVVQKPTKAMRFQPILMTEQRKMTDVLLNGLISDLPRHDTSSDTVNKVLSTDVSASAGGARRSTEGILLDMIKLVLCGTNVPAERACEGECLQTLRSTMVLMPPGGPRDAGKANRKRKIDEVHHDASKNDCMFFQKDEERAQLCPGMCIAPLLSTSIALMNDFGLIRVEISEMVTDLYGWYYWMFSTYFRWVCCPSLSNSFQRLLYGWRARGVADTLLYRTIGHFAKPRVEHPGAPDDAVTDIIFSLAFDAHDMQVVPTQVHQNICGVIDGQVIIVSRFVATVLRVPIVPFAWLTSVLNGELAVDPATDKNALLVKQWLTAMIVSKCFLPQDSKQEVDSAVSSDVIPYVCTCPNSSGVPSQEDSSLIRFPSNGHNTTASVAAKFINSPQANMAYESMGVPKDVNIYKNAIQTFCSTCVETSLYFNGFDIFDVAGFMDLFGVPNVPASFRTRQRFMQDSSWELGKIFGIGGENARYTVMGVHVTAMLVTSSLLLSNSEGRFHSNMASNSARNVLQAITRHAAKSSFAGDGNTVHIKNFAYAESAPRPTIMQTQVNETGDAITRDYFLRPKYDMRMHRSCKLGYLPGRYRGYSFEDTCHMHGVLSFLQKMNIDSENIAYLPISSMCFDYAIMKNRVYPLLFCDNSRGYKTGSVVLKESSCIFTVMDNFEAGNAVVTETSIAKFSSELNRLNALVYALVHRRNAVVFSGSQGFGTIVPHPLASPLTYFDSKTLSYRIHWANGVETTVPYLALDPLLLSLGAHVYVRFTCEAIRSFAHEITLPVCGTLQTSVFRCNIYYPSETQERDYKAVYINVPIRRRQNGYVQRGISEVYKIGLGELVSDATVQEEGLFTSDILWVGI
eukprot:543055-Rhodomonas_salina.5